MVNSSYRHVVLIIDRSGSMAEYADGNTGKTKAALANDGLADFLTTQRANPLHTTISLYQFDNQHETVVDFALLDHPRLADYRLVPRGSTALLDAVGRAITSTGERLAVLDERGRPGEVTCVIITDGHENSSSTYTLERIREMITHQQDAYGWHFVFLGADPDAFDQGIAMGVPAASSIFYTAGATAQSLTTTSRSLNLATASGAPPVFTLEDRKELAEES
jgi:Mg-chelatase subunit ChlD